MGQAQGAAQDLKVLGLDKYVVSSPHTDIDTTFTYNGDGTISQIVITGLGQTKTLVFSYGGGNLTSIACVIT